MNTTNYFDTFIAVADDCPVEVAEIPVMKADKPTVASLQFDLLKNSPYKYDSDSVFFQVHATRKNLAKSEIPAAKEIFFSRGQPCFRASPLTKRYGWGIHSDKNGKVAMYAVESAEYAKLLKDKNLKQLKAMKTVKKL